MIAEILLFTCGMLAFLLVNEIRIAAIKEGYWQEMSVAFWH